MAVADEPTAIRVLQHQWHRNWWSHGSPRSALDMYGPGAVERAPLSQTAPEDRCRTCWPTTKETR